MLLYNVHPSPKPLGKQTMASKRKPSSFEVLGGASIAVIALLAMIPRDWWVTSGLVALGIYFYRKSRVATVRPPDTLRPDSLSSPTVLPAATRRAAQATSAVSPTHSSPPFVNVRPAAQPVSVGTRETSSQPYRIPDAPSGYGRAKWLAEGEATTIAGVEIPGGLIYVGISLPTPSGGDDPALINPSLTVASCGSYTESEMGYWPSYSGISSSARRAYLEWLSSGRSDPAADIGYVFLFFYGLERRAVLDAAEDPAVKTEWSVITAELRRLLEIYGEQSRSFRNYAGALLDWVSLAEFPGKAYLNPVPTLPRTYDLPLHLRIALGQAARDGAAVPPHLALAWVKLDPTVALRTAAKRCNEEFDQLFASTYQGTYGDGMLLQKNRTRLKLVYRPASSGFYGRGKPTLTIGDTPDVTAVTGPIKKLQSIVDSVTAQLERYSRYCAKNPDAKHALEGFLLLPVPLWPVRAKEVVLSLRERTAQGVTLVPFRDLIAGLGGQRDIDKPRAVALVLALGSQGVGVEPDVLGGARVPKPDESVALFAIEADAVGATPTPSYQAAVLTVQLATAVAGSDGGVAESELSHIREQVSLWSHLSSNHICRLTAHIELLRIQPASLASLKRKLQPLGTAAKEAIARFMVTVAQADGTVSPAEVKMLERVYRALGVDPDRVFTDLHSASAGSEPAGASSAKGSEPFKLDAQRIAALQKDTEAVSVLLATIFTENEPAEPLPAEREDEPDQEVAPQFVGLLGLDEGHSAFARLLLSRDEWAMDELEDAVADLGLMLSGAIEMLNEAALDHYQIPFFEGEDPVTVSSELLEKLSA